VDKLKEDVRYVRDVLAERLEERLDERDVEFAKLCDKLLELEITAKAMRISFGLQDNCTHM
jgi:hypothetical protein